VDTALIPPDDCCGLEDAPMVRGDRYAVEGRSAVVLVAKANGEI
jgi:hypothetical protein